MLTILKLIVLFGFIFCNFENNLAKSISSKRNKRDNEAILYGNQQGSPHKTIKKSGPLNSLESHMSNKKSDGALFESPDHYNFAKRVVKRAKRSLVQQSMETGMGSNPTSYGTLLRKKRFAEYDDDEGDNQDEIDPAKLEEIRNILSSQYDMYKKGGEAYRDDGDDSRMVVVPSRELIERLEDQVVSDNEPPQEVVPYEEEEEEPSPQIDPRIQQLMLAQAIEKEQEKRDEEKRRRRKREEIRKRSELRKRQEIEEPSVEEVENNLVTKGYQLVEINGIPGVFMPFTEEDLERAEAEREIERRLAAEQEKRRRKRSDNGQLKILAEMLANNGK